MRLFSIIKQFFAEGIRPSSKYSKSVVRILLFKFCFIMGFLLFFYGPHVREDIDDKIIETRVFNSSNVNSGEIK